LKKEKTRKEAISKDISDGIRYSEDQEKKPGMSPNVLKKSLKEGENKSRTPIDTMP